MLVRVLRTQELFLMWCLSVACFHARQRASTYIIETSCIAHSNGLPSQEWYLCAVAATVAGATIMRLVSRLQVSLW